jgi:hypothetical protein
MYNECNIFIIIKTLTPLPHWLKYIPLAFKKLSGRASAPTCPPQLRHCPNDCMDMRMRWIKLRIVRAMKAFGCIGRSKNLNKTTKISKKVFMKFLKNIVKTLDLAKELQPKYLAEIGKYFR